MENIRLENLEFEVHEVDCFQIESKGDLFVVTDKNNVYHLLVGYTWQAGYRIRFAVSCMDLPHNLLRKAQEARQYSGYDETKFFVREYPFKQRVIFL